MSEQAAETAELGKAGKQPGVSTFFKPAGPNPLAARLEEDALLRMVIMRHEPFSVVEDPDFRAYQRSLNKKALLYTNRSVKDLLRTRTLSKREVLLNFFTTQTSGQGKITPASTFVKLPCFSAVTSDSWTSAKKETYTSLSLHAIPTTFDNLFSFPFDIEQVEGHTYGVNVADKIASMAAAWGASVTVAVTDCEPSMVASWRNMEHGAQGCFDHRLEKVSAVFFDCPGHKDTMIKCRALAGHFHHSSQANAKLKESGKLVFGAEHPDGLGTVQVC